MTRLSALAPRLLTLFLLLGSAGCIIHTPADEDPQVWPLAECPAEDAPTLLVRQIPKSGEPRGANPLALVKWVPEESGLFSAVTHQADTDSFAHYADFTLDLELALHGVVDRGQALLGELRVEGGADDLDYGAGRGHGGSLG